MKEYDVIVAGCGPAGSAAGKTLSENGFSVAMLDKAVFPRPKLCGGLLTWKSMMLLQDVFGETPESLEAAGAINYKSDSYQVFFKNELISTSIADYPFHFADRSVFDHVLLKKSAQAGCDHYLGQAVTHCDCDQGIVQTKTGQKFRARYIIGADGINSVVRRSIPFSLKKWKNGLASTFEVAVPAQDCPIAVDCPTLYLGFNDAGYGWVFPNKDKMVIGLGGLARRNKGLENCFTIICPFWDSKTPGRSG